MKPETKTEIIRILNEYKGDDLYRAQAAFRGYSPKEMQQEYGSSGRTRQEIIDGYQQKVDKIELLIEEVKQSQ